MYIYLHVQEQYVFIHDAVLEWLTCGDTQITPTNLRRELVRLDTVSADTQLTGYEQQFKVMIHNRGFVVDDPLPTFPDRC